MEIPYVPNDPLTSAAVSCQLQLVMAFIKLNAILLNLNLVTGLAYQHFTTLTAKACNRNVKKSRCYITGNFIGPKNKIYTTAIKQNDTTRRLSRARNTLRVDTYCPLYLVPHDNKGVSGLPCFFMV